MSVGSDTLTILMPLSDAFGGHGGIALYNRDVLAALSDSPRVAKVIALPRIAAAFDEPLPAKVEWREEAARGPLAFAWAALRAALGGRCDVIWCAHVNLLPLCAALKVITGARLVLAIYGVEAWSRFERAGPARALGWVDRVVSISRFTAGRFAGWSRFPVARIAIVANAIDLSRYADGARESGLVDRYGLEGREVVMILGRMHPTERQKGFDELLEALPALARRRPRVVALLVGDGGDRPRLEARARELGVADRVRFAGRVAEAEKAAHYRLADAFVMPGRQEGFGFVHLEAMACGTPTVASILDGSREAVREGEIGRLANPDDRKSIVSETIAALDTPRGVPALLAHFGYPRFSAEIAAVLDDLVAQ